MAKKVENSLEDGTDFLSVSKSQGASSNPSLNDLLSTENWEKNIKTRKCLQTVGVLFQLLLVPWDTSEFHHIISTRIEEEIKNYLMTTTERRKRNSVSSRGVLAATR